MPNRSANTSDTNSLYRFVSATRDAPGVVFTGSGGSREWAFVNRQGNTVFVAPENRTLQMSVVWGKNHELTSPRSEPAYGFCEYIELTRRSLSRTLARIPFPLCAIPLERDGITLNVPVETPADVHEQIAGMTREQIREYAGPLGVELPMPPPQGSAEVDALKAHAVVDEEPSIVWGQIFKNATLTLQEKEEALHRGSPDMGRICGFDAAFDAWAQGLDLAGQHGVPDGFTFAGP